MVGSKGFLIAPILFLLLLMPSSTYAQPGWLRKGVYAVYRFSCAYAWNGSLAWGPHGWELFDVGGGYYKWEVVEVDNRLALLRVTLATENFTRSVEVVIDAETMDLIEDGKVWGKAWLWIDLAKLLPSPLLKWSSGT